MNLNTEKRLCVCVYVRVCVCVRQDSLGLFVFFFPKHLIYLTLIFYMCIYKRSTSHISQHLTICR